MLIQLTKGKETIIDDADLGLVSPYKWFATFSGCHWYAAARIDSRNMYMHRLLTGAQGQQRRERKRRKR